MNNLKNEKTAAKGYLLCVLMIREAIRRNQSKEVWGDLLINYVFEVLERYAKEKILLNVELAMAIIIIGSETTLLFPLALQFLSGWSPVGGCYWVVAEEVARHSVIFAIRDTLITYEGCSENEGLEDVLQAKLLDILPKPLPFGITSQLVREKLDLLRIEFEEFIPIIVESTNPMQLVEKYTVDYPLDDFIEWFLDWAQPLLEKSNKINLSINLPEIPSKAPLAIGSPILENGSKLFANKRVQFEESVPKVLETSESCSETVDSSLTGSDSDFEDLSFSEREEVVEKLQDEHCSTFSGWSENHGTFRKVVSLENEKDTSISSKKRSIQEIGTPDRPTKRITLNDDHLSPLQSFQFRHSNIQLVRSQDSYPSTKSEATSKKGLSGAIWNFFELFGQS